MTTRCILGAVLAALFVGCATTPSAGVVEDLAAASRRFLDALPPQQRELAMRPLDDAEAMAWQFVPGRYAGVELGALDPQDQARAHAVLRAVLSARGYARTQAIVALENVLREMESTPERIAEHRDPGRYALLVCGEPDPTGSFVVRFQGHHVSLRVAVVDGVLAGHTPHFLGTNPHRLPEPAQNPRMRLEPVLGDEEELGRLLLGQLDDAQRQRAVISDTAPPDVLLGPGKPPSALGERRGLRWSEMSDEQRGTLWRLLEIFAWNYRDELAQQELDRIRARDLDELCFAWAGGVEPGKGHYYRIHGRHFAIEYDNTQNGANHVHTVWRDFDRDFGGDPLREHLEQQHGRGPQR